MPYKKKPRHSPSSATPTKTGRSPSHSGGGESGGREGSGQSRKRMNMDKKYGSGIKQKMKGKMTDKK